MKTARLESGRGGALFVWGVGGVFGSVRSFEVEGWVVDDSR